MLDHHAQNRACRERRVSLVSFVLLLGLLGCRQSADVQLHENEELAAFVQLMMPAKIEVQHFLTKPFDFSGSGNADGVEVILAALDSFGDPVKCVGTLHFELFTMRMASGDKLGERVAFWPVEIDSVERQMIYWQRFSRYYRFELRLSDRELAPGRYILTARLITPTDEKLFDTYEFSYGAP